MGHTPFGHRAAPPKPASHAGGAGTQVPSDLVVRFSEVVNSTLNARTKAVQYSVLGIADADDPSNDAKAESVDDAEPYTSPGIVGRPLPPRLARAGEQHMDVMCIITSDGLVPVGYRDNRLKMGGNGPAAGVLAFVGYGGGFHSMTPVVDPDPPPAEARNPDPAGGGTIHVLYCPYDFDDNGVARKAHSLILDPTQGNESVMLVHAEGMAMTMLAGDKNALVLKNKAGDATFRVDDDGITMTAKQIVLSGGVTMGEPATAVPLLPGIASPGSTKVYVSP